MAEQHFDPSTMVIWTTRWIEHDSRGFETPPAAALESPGGEIRMLDQAFLDELQAFLDKGPPGYMLRDSVA
jgi:hypothetical protein